MVYAINGRTFSDLESYERMPLQKFFELIAIHIEAVDTQKAELEKARRGAKK